MVSQAPAAAAIYIGTTGTGGGFSDILNAGVKFTGFNKHGFTSIGSNAVVLSQSNISNVGAAVIYDAIQIREIFRLNM